MSAVWFAAISFAVVLVLLLIFILENNHKVQISYFGAHGNLPLGVALLFAAVLGILLVAVPGTARIIQLRIHARRNGADSTGLSRGAPEPAEPPRPRTSGSEAAKGSPSPRS